MKTFFRFACVLAVAFSVSTAQATLALNATGTVTYAFTGYDGSAAPADWDISAPNAFSYLGFDRGSGTSVGVRAYTNSLPSANRALGFLGNTTTLTNYFADLTVSNNTGLTLTSLTLSFDVLQYRVVNGTRVSSITFTNLSELSLPSQTFLAVTNLTSGLQDPPLALGSYSQTITDLNLSQGDTFTLRWIYNSGLTTGAAQGLALDNIQITVVPEPSTFLLVGLALLPVLFRRRR